MRISRVAIATTVLAGATAAGFGLTTGTALADSDEKLPITTFGDIAVDAVHHRVFVSDPTSGKIVSTNYQGHEATAVTGLAGVDGLALSADSNVLYAAVSGGHRIAAIATDTLTETASYPVGDTVAIRDVVGPISGKLWFSTIGGNVGTGTIGSVDLATSAVAVHDARADGVGLYTTPMISTGAGAPGLVVLTDASTTSGDSVVYDVSSGAADLKLAAEVFGEFTSDVAISGDGADLIQAGYNGSHRIAISDGTKTAAFTSLNHFGGVEVAADGRVALSLRGGSHDVYVFQPGATTPKLTFALPSVAGSYNRPEVVGRGLAWEPGGSRIFAVAQGDGTENNYWLYTLNDSDPVEPDPTTASPSPSTSTPSPGPSGTSSPEPLRPTIWLTAPATATRGQALTITGSINANMPLPAGKELALWRHDMETTSSPSLDGVTTTDANGEFRFASTPPVGGRVIYDVVFKGDEQYLPATASAVVQVSRTTPGLTLDKNKTVNAYGTTVTFTATLGATYKNRVVEIWADPYGADQGNRLLKRATVNSAGKVSAGFKLTRNTTLTARFAGDARYAPRTVTSVAYTKVAVNTKITRHYRTKKIGSVTYYVVRTTKDPHFITTMTAYPNRFHRLVIQRYKNGKWTAFQGATLGLDKYGVSEAWITGYYPAGQRFRVRAEYGNSPYGDKINATTYGSWKYYTYAK
ncbi:YncE family protein [Actinoplanes flavus]|uniref:Ig-like domain repeat protein n=1 Tax=Actinoplanes flavus TaxID=2820290 RepID=A0ABS3UPD6_9ACTN|nr:hypothetical protein [Actinoplanes flavus]MBO3740101.1 hypothetical protein [Actinoplanes flavus]